MYRTLIIAEAGVNHNGQPDLALRLIDVAREAGADYVKFQTFRTELLVSKQARKAAYQLNDPYDSSDTQYDMLKRLELSTDTHFKLKNHADQVGIKFLSTGFDTESIDFLEQFNMDFYKIPSGEITNYPFLRHIALKGRPVIISTGMATLSEVRAALNVFLSCGLKKEAISLLHCNTEYPTPMQDVNLRAIHTLKEAFGLSTGYSDHTLGIEIPIAAVCMGASIIEKHFTLDKTMQGPDHKASLDPTELCQMVQAIRNVELALSGNGIKTPSASEQKNIEIARRSIHTNRRIHKGEVIACKDLIMLRPGGGIPPFDLEKVAGLKAAVEIDAFTKVSWDNLE